MASTKGPPKWIPPQGLALHTRAPQMGFIACCARDPSHTIVHLQRSWPSHHGGCAHGLHNGHRLSIGSADQGTALLRPTEHFLHKTTPGMKGQLATMIFSGGGCKLLRTWLSMKETLTKNGDYRTDILLYSVSKELRIHTGKCNFL